MNSYQGKAEGLIKSAKAEIGDRVRVEKKEQTFEGLLMPRTEGREPDHIVLKLDNGYNVGLQVSEETRIEKIKEGKEPEMGKTPVEVEPDPDKPDVTIIGTGGTVASKIDYRTGAVHPAFSTAEIYNMSPEIAEIANIRAKTACNVLSENMTPELWSEIGEKTVEELRNDAEGVVIAHGTDTMGYTASALSFMLENLNKPVVLVGSQRSSDRPSSDAALNLIGAVSTASSNLSGVYTVMHGSTEDEFCLIHPGTKVRKCHTSRRDAFQTINETPIGRVNRKGEIELFREEINDGEEKEKLKLRNGFEEKVALLKVYPNIQSDIIRKLIEDGYKGIVLEGTGLGHAPKSLQDGIEEAINEDIPVAMTSQCLWGRTNMRVYSTGRDLLDKGVFSLEDMLPETAYVKMMWVLDKTQEPDEVESLMKENLAGEISDRSRADTYLKSNLPEED